jgi:hypothetical protein
MSFSVVVNISLIYIFSDKTKICDIKNMASAPITENHIDTTTTTSTSIQAHHHTRQFDLKVVRDAFANCVQSDKTLLLREYVRAYEELCV